jgi:hypothetical protein
MQAVHELVPINTISLDHNNPRIAKFLEMYEGTPNSAQIYLALGAGSKDMSTSGTSFSSLRESIRTNKGIIQPIIINREKDKSMVVLEGNTRLAIYQDFFKESKDSTWEKIPAVVYTDLDQEQQDSIRLQAHLVGPRQWEAYAKGKYLHHLRTNLDFPMGKLIDYCGGRKKEVQDYIQAYVDIEQFYRPAIPEGGIFDASRFSAFVELQKSGIKDSILQAGYSFEDFGRWVDTRLIDPLNKVRSLPKILANEKARNVFLTKGAKEALKFLESPEVTKVLETAKMTVLARALVVALEKIGHAEVKKLINNPESDDSKLIADLYTEVSGLYNDIYDD